MRDYEESVSKLREYAEWIGPNNYELPITMYDDLLEAADSIEELQAENNELLFRCGQAEALIDYYQGVEPPLEEN